MTADPLEIPLASAPAALPPGVGVRLRDGVVTGAHDRRLTGAGADRVLYLRPRAVRFVRDLPAVPHDSATRTLARTLLDAGVAEPWWPQSPPVDADVEGVTVVVPVHDRPAGLARLLAALPPALAVVVVDDASADPRPLAAIAARHGALLLRHERNQGPAAARNTGLRAVRSPLVAFCDSDVVPQPGWLGVLRRHLDDPVVALAAPRMLGLARTGAGGSRSWLERYESERSSLDLGPRAAQVRPRGPVSYVPSACLLARVEALAGGFDEQMRSGEDVDLVWRLVAAGWRVRYDPAAVACHDHRTGPLAWARRKAFYGSSAADLARRHGDAVAPLVLAPWTAVVAVALLAQRRWSLPAAAVSWGAATALLARRLPGDDAWRAAADLTLRGLGATASQTAASLTRHHWPVALLAATRSRRARRAWLVAAAAEGVLDHRARGAGIPVGPYLVVHRADDIAYGAGLWRGALRARSARALCPALVGWRGRPRRGTPGAGTAVGEAG